MAAKIDPSSAATIDAVCQSIHLELDVDFERKVLAGSALLTAQVKVDGASHLVLDTRGLAVSKVSDEDTGATLEHDISDASLGSALRIQLPAGKVSSGSTVRVRVRYETSPDASAIQWLDASQTQGKQHPYLFTQCQAIHARSMLPCQDTPAVKCPYTASITVPADLIALMSAASMSDSVSGEGRKTYTFDQKVPMPAYLVALVVGRLDHRDISPRCRVWSEAEIIEASAWEFAECDTMLQAAEKLLGPYVWGRYDLLVLPPSFPYGGMENPMLTFVTPTLLAGDRSLTSVVIHEITHSWTGNLVTNNTWEHFWLNEGFTVFAERKILGALQGELARQASAIGGLEALRDSVAVFGEDSPLTSLLPPLDGTLDPDDAFSSVPYEKGSNLLYYLEQLLGGPEEFDPWLRAYIDKHKYQSIDTDTFKAFLYSYFHAKKDLLDTVDWESWFHKPGMPPVTNKFDSTLVDAAIALANNWLQPAEGWTGAAADIADFSSKQMQVFLATLLAGETLSTDVVGAMDAAYGFSDSKNSEVKFRWQRLCLRASYEPVFKQVVAFVTSQGRMKYVRPLYRDLHQCSAAGDLAKTTFVANRGMYHNIASSMIAKDLGL